MAADPGRRRAAIADLSKRRTILFWCATLITVCAVLSACASGMAGKPAVSSALLLCAALEWIVVFKFDSDLRLLQVIEKLQRSREEKPAA